MQRLVVMMLGAVFLMVLGARALTSAEPEEATYRTGPGVEPRERTHMARRKSDDNTTVIPRDSSGQFHLVAQVNGQDVRFLIDTGADTVALTVAEAEAVGLDFNEDDFEPISRTASGVGTGAAVMLDRVQVGGAEFHDVEAMVLDGLDTNLLGQSVLARLGRVELSGDTMIIHLE